MPIELKDGEAVEMSRTLLNVHSPLGEAVVGGIWREILDRMRYLNGTIGPVLAQNGKAMTTGFETCRGMGRATAAAAAEKSRGGASITVDVQPILPQELVTQTRENGFMKASEREVVHHGR